MINKKLTLSIVFIVAIAIFNTNLNKAGNKAGKFAITNVEVLAQAEISNGEDCYYGGTYYPDCPEVLHCEDCSY